MRMIDYQTGKELHDVSLCLTNQELEDLTVYLHRLHSDDHLNCTHLTTLSGVFLDTELTVAVEGRHYQSA